MAPQSADLLTGKVQFTFESLGCDHIPCFQGGNLLIAKLCVFVYDAGKEFAQSATFRATNWMMG